MRLSFIHQRRDFGFPLGKSLLGGLNVATLWDWLINKNKSRHQKQLSILISKPSLISTPRSKSKLPSSEIFLEIEKIA